MSANLILGKGSFAAIYQAPNLIPTLLPLSNPMASTLSCEILTTSPPRRSFPLPTSPESYFTGDLFDRFVLFLHKHCVTFTSIECVARGVDKATALRDGPTLCVYVVQNDSVTGGLVQRGNEGDEKVKKRNEGGWRKELVVVKERKKTGEEAKASAQERGWSEEAGEAGENPRQDENLGKQQTEELGHYAKEVAQVFKKCQFAREIPPEIRFVEFVSVILHEDSGKNMGATGTWANTGVMGFLKGS